MYLRSLSTAAVALVAAAIATAPASAATVVSTGNGSYTFSSALSGTINDTSLFSGLTSGSSLLITFGGGSTGTFSNLSAVFTSSTGVTTTAALASVGNLFIGMLTPTAGNINSLTLTGSTTGTGSYAGTLTVLSSAVPEVSTWAMMTLGFGALGYSLRRRRTSFTFA